MMSGTGQIVNRISGQFVRKFQQVTLQAGMLAAVVATLSGCGGAFNNLPSVNVGDNLTQTPLGSIKGQMYGGQSAVYQSHVYLMKASHNGYGTPSSSMLTGGHSNTFMDTSVIGTASNPVYYVTTDTAGNFDITGDYSCTYNATHPEQSDLLYLVGIGGQTNFSFNQLGLIVPGTNNPYIGEMAVLGQCPSDGTFAGHISYIYVGEVSTVAAAYALAPFASSSYNVGSPNTPEAEVGMTNAFSNANLLYDIQGSSALHEGRALTASGNGSVPYLLIDTMANIVANCVNNSVNQGGGVGTTTGPSDTICRTLWTNTGSNTTDTASALIYIAQHPTRNVAALFALQASNFEFVDRLTTQPNDFTIGINYSSGAFSNAVDVAVDGIGNAWVTNSDGDVAKVTPTGSIAPITAPGASYVAIDTANNAWVTSNMESGAVYQFDNAGNLLNGYGNKNFYNDINYPMGIAMDGNGNTFIANSGGGTVLLKNFLLGNAGDVVRINGSGGTATSSSYYQSLLGQTLNGIPQVSQVAVDNQGYMWLSGDTSACVASLLLCVGENVERVQGANAYANLSLFPIPVLPLNLASFTTQTGTIPCFIFVLCGAPTEQTNGIAIDASNKAWVALSGTTSQLDSVDISGNVTTFTGGGLNAPQGVAIDGAGNVFVANTGSGSITQYASLGTSKGFVTGTKGITGASNNTSSPASLLNRPFNLDIDGSGDVWVANAAPNYGFVTEFISLAAPTLRPLAKAASSAKLANMP